jgi:hypothetical protein
VQDSRDAGFKHLGPALRASWAATSRQSACHYPPAKIPTDPPQPARQHD